MKVWKIDRASESSDPTDRDLELVAIFIGKIGLRLSSKLDELFESVARPSIDQQVLIHGPRVLGDFMQVREIRSAGQTTRLRFPEKGLMTLGRERVVEIARQQLRAFSFIGAGRRPGASSFEVIMPEQWEMLSFAFGHDTASDAGVTYEHVHIAHTNQLDSSHLGKIRQKILAESSRQMAAPRETKKGAPGRPTLRPLILEIQLERWASGRTAKFVSAEASAIAEELESRRGDHQLKVPKSDSIETIIRPRYHRLKRMRKGVKYLSGNSLTPQIPP